MNIDEKIGRIFYSMLSALSDEVVISDKFCESMKKHMFEYTITNYDDLTPADRELYNTAAYKALQEGIDILGFLMTTVKGEKNNGA